MLSGKRGCRTDSPRAGRLRPAPLVSRPTQPSAPLFTRSRPPQRPRPLSPHLSPSLVLPGPPRGLPPFPFLCSACSVCLCTSWARGLACGWVSVSMHFLNPGASICMASAALSCEHVTKPGRVGSLKHGGWRGWGGAERSVPAAWGTVYPRGVTWASFLCTDIWKLGPSLCPPTLPVPLSIWPLGSRATPLNQKGTCRPALSTANSCVVQWWDPRWCWGGARGEVMEGQAGPGCRDQQSCRVGTPWQMEQGLGTGTLFGEPGPLGRLGASAEAGTPLPGACSPGAEPRPGQDRRGGALGAKLLRGVQCYFSRAVGPLPL